MRRDNKQPANHGTRVLKKIAPGERGAKSLSAEYGDRLVCVRQRIDATGARRLTTVELVVAQKPIAHRPSPMVDLAIRAQERELQAQVKAAGGRWDPREQVWRLRRATALALGLKSRIVP